MGVCRVVGRVVVVGAAALVITLPAGAQDIGTANPAQPMQAGGVVGGGKTVAMPAPSVDEMEWSETLPLLTPEQEKQLEAWLARSNRSGRTTVRTRAAP